MLGLEIDEPIEQAIERLKGKGVKFVREIERSPEGNFVHFEDTDGSELYLWETVKWG
jgi:predicted enzyme related to lactoylglutathione lyase